MTSRIKAIRGMGDILPTQTPLWRATEALLLETVASYGFSEIRLPLVESTALYARAIGAVTDIVEKEMYTFADRGGDSISLRPEGTAGCVRAALEHGLLHNQTAKLYYQGPMFRYERPQKGRYRQFHQFGVEALGFVGPYMDVELMLLSARLWHKLGVSSALTLEINSLGDAESRQRYRSALVEYLKQHHNDLDADSQRRLETNPLRVLDSKEESTRAVLQHAPVITEFLDEESAQHLAIIRDCLHDASIAFRVNPYLVRGLDYYNRTVFEWVTAALGAQGTVCAGGRYDGLVAQLGGNSIPAVGMAIGMERLVLLLEQTASLALPAQADMVVLGQGVGYERMALLIAEQVRSNFPRLKIQVFTEGGGFKSQFRRADRSGAVLALILGEDEMAGQQVTIKWLRDRNVQRTVALTQLIDTLGATDGIICGSL